MDAVEADLTELDAFGDELAASADQLLDAVKPVVAQGAMDVRTAMRADIAASPHFKQVARAITYDTRTGAGWVEAEIGPKTAGAVVGDLAHLAYFGGAHGGGGTVRDPQEALDDEAPYFEQALGDVLANLLEALR